MALSFFKDAELNKPISQDRPVSIVVGTNGGEKETSVWLGDAYSTIAVLPANAGSTSVVVQDVSQFPSSGRAWIRGRLYSYSGISGNSLTGLSLDVDVKAGDKIRPHNLYVAQENVSIRPAGPQLQEADLSLLIQTKRPDQTSYGLPGGRALYEFIHGNPHEGLQVGLRFDEGAGTTAKDYSGNGHHGTLSGQTWDTGMLTGSGALMFIGANSLQLSGSVSGVSGGGAFEAVLRPSPAASGTLFSAGSQLNVSLNGPQPVVTFAGTGWSDNYAFTQSLAADEFSYLAVSWSSSKVRLYINGAECGSYTLSHPLEADLSGMEIGSNFSGLLDEFRLYNRTLHASEVSTRYNKGSFLGLTDGPLPTLRLDMLAMIRAGSDKEFDGWGFRGNVFYDPGITTELSAPEGFGYVYRHDQGVLLRARVLDATRQTGQELPGFIFGEYRWRDAAEQNSQHILSTSWDHDPNVIGPEKFTAGIGDGDDLKLVELIKPEDRPHSILPRIRSGFYFTGHLGYYLPDDNCRMEIVTPAVAEQQNLEIILQSKPAQQKPIFVGTFRRDEKGFYEKDVCYRYVGDLLGLTGGWDEEDAGYQFNLNRKLKKITLNRLPKAQDEFLTIAPSVVGSPVTKNFELPVYPIQEVFGVVAFDHINQVEKHLQFTYTEQDRIDGTISVTFTSDIAAGTPIYLKTSGGLAVIYEDAEGEESNRIVELDLNPAFAGISSGYLYLQHSSRRAASVELFADKARILVPATHAGIPGLVAFGPVYYEGDYALLMATTYSHVPGEVVSGVRLKVVAGSDFRGLINYRNPLSEDIELVTGSDGTATFIYTPGDSYGFYLPTSFEGYDGDRTLTLPDAVPLSQIYNETDGWLVRTYKVRNDDPFFGRLSSLDPIPGQIDWRESGTKGTTSYKVNGRRVLLGSSRNPLVPSDALDINGFSRTNPLFNGSVKRLVYASPLPNDSNIGAYFVTYLGRVTLQVKTADTNILSNSIMLQLDVPPIVSDDSGVYGYLRPGPLEQLSELPEDFSSYPEGTAVVVSGTVYISTGSDWEDVGPVSSGGVTNTKIPGLLNLYRLGGAPIQPINVLPNRF